MVAAEPVRYGALPAEGSTRRSAAFKYAGVAVGLVAVCAVASMMYTSTSSPNELLTDSVTVANKILAAQRFKKANGEERASFVKDALTKNTEHKSGKAVIGKIAGIVAKKNMSYHERMEAMKKLLDSQTDSIKDKSIHHLLHAPAHASAKKHARGRDAKEEAKDNQKAIKDAGKLIVTAAKKSKDSKTLHATKHDKQVHEETEKTAADPKKEADWMKDQLSKGKQVKKEQKGAKEEKQSASQEAEKSKAASDKALEEGVKLMKKLQTKKHDLHSSLKMSAKDEAERKESEKKQLKPADEAKWLKSQLHSAKKAAVQKLALKKATAKHSKNRSSPESKQQKLIKWAEAHGLPKKLVDNPKDKQKVKDIIARMKADAEVERIKDQMKHDDSMVSGVVHSADPSAAGVI